MKRCSEHKTQNRDHQEQTDGLRYKPGHSDTRIEVVQLGRSKSNLFVFILHHHHHHNDRSTAAAAAVQIPRKHLCPVLSTANSRCATNTMITQYICQAKTDTCVLLAHKKLSALDNKLVHTKTVLRCSLPGQFSLDAIREDDLVLPAGCLLVYGSVTCKD